jgi:hypothetical protein
LHVASEHVRIKPLATSDFVSSAIFNNVTDLYTTNASAPLNEQAGLRDSYEFGFYSYCAYVSDNGGICSNRTTAHAFKPFDAVSADMPQIYRVISGTSIIPLNLTFKDSKYTGQTSKAAYWMILLGTICAALTLITGFAKSNLTFFVSTIFSIAGSLFLLIGSSLWTVLIKKTEAINSSGVEIFVSEGTGLFLLWASFVCLFLSVIPSVLSCCTYR